MSSNITMFTGTSRYSADFQRIISRTVAIASLPMAQLETQKATLETQSSALAAVESKFASLRSAIQTLNTAATSYAYASSVSDGAVARATVSGSVFSGAYTVEVVDIGSFTSAMSADGLTAVADPSSESISPASGFTLAVDGVEYTIEPASNSLNALAEAINASEADVDATVVNIGTSASPDYRLSIRSTRLGGVAVQINDGGEDLLNTLATGSVASYKINGQPAAPITTDSRTVTVGPGLSVTLLKAGTAEISVARDTNGIGTALSSLAAAYNAAADALDSHRGENPGALAGNSILYTLASALREITGYSGGSDDVTSLAALGLVFGDNGRLSFDASTFSSVASGSYAALREFLGSVSTSGFLKAAGGVLDGLEDSTGGALTTAVSALDGQIATQAEWIQKEQSRIDDLEESLLAQMAAADALIAALEQKVNYFTNLFQSMMETQKRWS